MELTIFFLKKKCSTNFFSQILAKTSMSNKDFAKTTKDLTVLLKKLTPEVQESANAVEYAKFLNKTLAKAHTFEKTHPSYINYAVKSMKPKLVKEATTTTSVSTEKATPKRKAETDVKKDAESTKKAKKVADTK